MAGLKIYTDENVDVRIAEGLKMRGVRAFSAIEHQMIGVADMEHFKYARKKKAVIFTHDRHFLEIAKKLVKQGDIHYGVVFVDLPLFNEFVDLSKN